MKDNSITIMTYKRLEDLIEKAFAAGVRSANQSRNLQKEAKRYTIKGETRGERKETTKQESARYALMTRERVERFQARTLEIEKLKLELNKSEEMKNEF